MRRIARLVIAGLLALGAGSALVACGDDDDSPEDEINEGVEDVEEGVDDAVDDAEDEIEDGS